MLRTTLLRWLIRLLGRLPLSAAQILGAFVGRIMWYSRSRMALVTRENIARCYPGLSTSDQTALAKASLEATGRTIIETAFAWTAPTEKCLRAIVDVRGRALVDTALAAGNGLIFVIPHLGNWEMINHYLGSEFGLTHMYQPNRSRRFNRLVQTLRARTGTKFVEANRTGIRRQLEVLREGGTVGVMPDQEPEIHTGRFAPFFGIPCLTNTLTTNLAARTGAATLVCYCERLPDSGGFRVVFAPFELPATGPDAALAAMNLAIEQAIRQLPEQYLWSYKRFRTRPQGEIKYYRFRQHPVRVTLESALIRGLLAAMRRLPMRAVRRIGALAGDIAYFTRHKYARHARINLGL
ncbi:MAG TPA: lysophospholipid acyltransferase family protein, partial [Pseudomonadales bacterium]|nr:lysophospholipid acyltransferase family protein [Pseudomonadales bacterium]